MRTISSVAELEKVIEDAARRTMEDSAKEILKLFKEKYVEKFAYVNGKPVKYPRAFEFRDAWIWGDIEKHATVLSMEMFNDWARMSKPSPRGKSPFRHTTFTSSSTGWPDDSRPQMASYLNNLNTSVWLTGNRAGGYWTKFIQSELDSGGLKRIIDKHARKYGFNPSGMSIR